MAQTTRVEVVVAQQLWVGVDAGKSDHHCVVLDAEGNRLLSQRVANDEPVLLELITAVSKLANGGEITWAIDLNGGGAALLICLLMTAEQRLLYIPGRTVHHASGSYRGEGKTDAKDAAIIADQARMRRDLQSLRVGDDIAVELRILTSRRTDLVADRTRAINRLRVLSGWRLGCSVAS
jgi:transposase